jgi:hypothetical protein
MAKKNLKFGIEGLLQPSVIESPKINNDKKKTVKATYNYIPEHLQKIKAIAYYDRKSINEVMNEALNQYLESYVDLKKAMKIAP